MVQIGQDPIRPVDFDSQLHPDLPVEVIDRHQLLGRVDRTYFAAPQRPSFYVFVLMRSSSGSHTVDFTEIAARPGRLIQIRPGQVQVWNVQDDFSATVVVSQPVTSFASAWFPGNSPYCDLDPSSATTAESLIDVLRHQQSRFNGDRATARLMNAVFQALVALFDQAQGDGYDPNLSEVYVAYRTAIETDLTHRHDVIDYARSLGYSARTITRACERATGQTAKQILTDRLVLEAKRMLAHTDAPAASISTQLGFSEPTNFTKFFQRNAGLTPSAFRRLQFSS